MTDSPAYCRHLFTVEASPADEMNPDAPGHVFVSRCVCGWDGMWLPYLDAMQAVGEHLKATGLIEETAEAAIAAAERERIAAWLHRAAAGRREYAERTPASHEVTPRLELAASCLESAAQLITDPQTMLDVIPSWRWTEDEIAALYGKDGSDG